MDTRQMIVIFSSLVLTQMTLGNIDEFDCVDIYKQPAFQHPLLKHHKIPEKFTSNESFDRKSKYKTTDQSCPKGTVAILRQRSETESLHLDTDDHFGHHFAVMDTYPDASIYRGAQADISIHNLTLQNNQLSRSQIWLENGPPGELNSIQVGWAADGYKTTGCYNTNCPGFIIVTRNPSIGNIFKLSSVYGGDKTVIFTPHVYQEFDCVVIYKQPAFQHPLLKHHKIPEKFTSNESFDRKNKYKTNDQSCPKGTLTILRQRSETENLHLDTIYQFGHHKLAAMQRDMEELKARQTDVLRRVESEEETRSTQRTAEVKVWLKNVDNISRQVSYLINNSAAELQKLSRSGLCSKNLRSNCGYGDRVALMSKKLNDLKSESVTKTAEKENEFDCVDIYKQPAFQHPLLKHHKIPEKFISNKSFDRKSKYKTTDQSCPKGTVAILRQRSETESLHLDTDDHFGHHFAVMDTYPDASIYQGAQADISIHNLTLQNNQLSRSQIWLENGPPGELNSIQVGWAADGYKTTGCYNTNCPGFIIVTRKPSIGSIFKLSSVYGGDKTVIFTPHVYQEFDCVDIYKQPAFQHPLLKHHKIPEKFTSNESFDRKNKYKTNDQSCPKGTVEILRQRSETESLHLDTVDQFGHHFAAMDAFADESNYRGAQADISIHNLTLQNNQYSKSQIWLENGPPGELGWAVHPRVYGDSATRLTIYWTVKCPGFIIITRKPSVGSIFKQSSVYGDKPVTFTPQVVQEFDCVDIYKQPAFQHPLLKHHKIPEKFTSNESFDRKNKYKTNDQICPKGTVAILRQRSETESVHLDTIYQFGHHFALMDASSFETIYRGAQADISIHNLTLQNNQYSKSQIWLENGPIAELNSIQVGWAVHPRVYGDSATRLTIYWTGDGYKTGCYNTECPGFIIITRKPSIGSIFKQSSVYGDKPVTFTPQVIQSFFGNWVLYVDDEIIGYWPGELFTHLNKGASRVRFGGNTFMSPDGISPPMGNGYVPIYDYERSSSFLQVKLMNDKYQSIEAETQMGVADSKCFTLISRDYTNETGNSFSFGGPGGSCGV
ncbi:unnamed protein product [Brassica rapa subsp. narinosa]